MAHEFYVTVEGSKQGKLKGESPREQHKDKLPGLGFHYSVSSPRESGSGQATGRRIHQPVSFVKEWGAATPQLFQALTTNRAPTRSRSSATVLPPAMQRPAAISRATSANSPGDACESASTNTSHSPAATAAPALRARAI